MDEAAREILPENLYDRHGALSDERGQHRMGAHAVVSDATGGQPGLSGAR